MPELLLQVFVLVVVAIGNGNRIQLSKRIAEGKISIAEEAAKRMLTKQKQAEATKEKLYLKLKEEIHKLRTNLIESERTTKRDSKDRTQKSSKRKKIWTER